MTLNLKVHLTNHLCLKRLILNKIERHFCLAPSNAVTEKLTFPNILINDRCRSYMLYQSNLLIIYFFNKSEYCVFHYSAIEEIRIDSYEI